MQEHGAKETRGNDAVADKRNIQYKNKKLSNNEKTIDRMEKEKRKWRNVTLKRARKWKKLNTS